MSGKFKPVGEVLPNLDILELPDGSQPLECIVIVRALDENMRPGWFFRWTKTLDEVDGYGAICAAADIISARLLQMYESTVEGEDES